MPANPNILRLLRKTHLYTGLFISPALLFFAFTGALQTFSLHETHSGGDYKPPRWAVVLGQIHKNQTAIVPARKPRPADKPQPSTQPRSEPASITAPSTQTSLATQKPPSPSPSRQPKPKSHLPLKLFFLLVSLGLFSSTLTGIYMAYKYERGKLLVTALLLAGAILPLLLLPF